MWCYCEQHPTCERGACALPAEYSILEHAWGRPRAVFVCDEHVKEPHYHGIHRPKNADEFWRPSIDDHVRHALINMAFEERKAKAAAQPYFTGYVTARMRSWTPGQWATHKAYVEGVRRLHQQSASKED